MIRIDQLLVQRGLASTRSQAQRLIASGVRCRTDGGWRRAVKNGELVAQACEIELLDRSEARFVSRGGLKLDGALVAVALDVAGWVCLDVGQSTGGFTDCLLQLGATQVVGIDVGFGQLHDRLRGDSRVICVERVNARHLGANDLTQGIAGAPEHLAPATGLFDLVVGDLSFISQTLVLPAVVQFLKPGGRMLMLVKPQFELQPGQVGKGGIVTDADLYAVVEKRIRQAHGALGLHVLSYFPSSIDGGDGNREFFVHSILQTEALP
jgi:23S rRNA (cytidine1920-2'-O)/16S rRNA (cytidine1409-2'-O)-methyltransferase